MVEKTVQVRGHVRKTKWKNDIDLFIKGAKEKLKKYERTKNELYLMQAGEKTWRAFVSLIKLKSKKDSASSRGRRYLAKKLGLEQLYRDAMLLHSYFYGGEADDLGLIKETIDATLQKIKKQVK